MVMRILMLGFVFILAGCDQSGSEGSDMNVKKEAVQKEAAPMVEADTSSEQNEYVEQAKEMLGEEFDGVKEQAVEMAKAEASEWAEENKEEVAEKLQEKAGDYMEKAADKLMEYKR